MSKPIKHWVLVRIALPILTLSTALLLLIPIHADNDYQVNKIAFVSKENGNSVFHIVDPNTSQEETHSLGSKSVSVGFPAWSPQCDRIALDQYENDLKVISVVGYGRNGISTNIPQLGPFELTAYLPRWSPDGSYIAFQAIDWDNLENNVDIYTVSTATGELKNLTNSPIQDTYPSWAPNGQQIIFSSIPKDNPHEYADINLIDANGSNLKAVYSAPATDDFAPQWSPDGDSIAFVSRDENGDRLLLIDKDDAVNDLTGSAIYKLRHFSWSNDSKYMAFSSEKTEDETQIYLLDVSSKAVEQLTNTPHAINMYASWSPDSGQIVFQSNRDGDFEIFTLDLETKDLHQLTDNQYDDIFPVWSPKSCDDN